jgi:peptidase M28-like protein
MRSPASILVCSLLLGGCSQAKNPEASVAPAQPAAAAPAIFKIPDQPVSSPRVDSARAMQYVKDVVGIGPRPVGSPGHRKLEEMIQSRLKGDSVEVDEFPLKTPVGNFTGRNIIAQYPGTKDGVIVISSHYDTNYPLKDYVGANDGGSTTGLLLELANELRSQMKDGKRPGYSVRLVWFDAEEAFVKWSDDDSLYGSKHLAAKWKQDGTLTKTRALFLLDMIGDADLNVDRDSNSNESLQQVVAAAASQLAVSAHFFRNDISITDDHIPFVEAGVPSVDLIDYTYGYNNVFHHSPEDTLDKLSPKSLEVVGNVVLRSTAILDSQ